MPFLFLLAGMFVMPSLKRRGYLDFAREKFFRLVIPFAVGIIFLVAPQQYFQYLVKEDPTMGYWEFWTTMYPEKMHASGFWFLYTLFIFMAGFLIINAVWPGFVKMLGRFVAWMTSRPIWGFLVFFVLSAVLLGSADLLWGPYFSSASFWKVFYIRPGSFGFIFLFYFLLGTGVAEIGLNQNQTFLEKLGQNWIKWVVLALITGSLYAYYCLAYFYDGIYNYEFFRFRYFEGSWDEAWPVLAEYAPPVLIRTTLLGLFQASLAVMYVSLFYRFLNQPNKVWMSLAACSFGIYIFHEPIQVGMTYLQYQSDISDYIKFAITTAISLGVSWLLVQKILLKLPGFNRVL